MAINSLDSDEAGIHEGKVLQALADQRFKNRGGLGALKGDQRMIVNDLQVHITALVLERLEMSTDVGQILISTTCIRDDIERVLMLANNGVVDDTTVLVGEDREC